MFNKISLEDNKLLSIYLSVQQNKPLPDFPEFVKNMEAEIGSYDSSSIDVAINKFNIRIAACRTYSWGVPTNDVIQKICEYGYQYGGIVEPGAGAGYWMSLIRKANNNKFVTIATDLNPWHLNQNDYGNVDSLYTTVEVGDAVTDAKMAAEKGYVLFTVWPEYEAKWTGDMIFEYLKNGGQCVLFIGEGPGGCTGSDRMHALLNKFFNRVIPSQTEDGFEGVRQWRGIRDSFYIFYRNDEHFDPSDIAWSQDFFEFRDSYQYEEEEMVRKAFADMFPQHLHRYEELTKGWW